jgi:hypothetical protein
MAIKERQDVPILEQLMKLKKSVDQLKSESSATKVWVTAWSSGD